jgi:hypothetical protein
MSYNNDEKQNFNIENFSKYDVDEEIREQDRRLSKSNNDANFWMAPLVAITGLYAYNKYKNRNKKEGEEEKQ